MPTLNKPLQLYKILQSDMTGPFQSSFKYPEPKKRPTKWLHCEGELRVCSNGFHAITKRWIWSWWDKGNRLFLCEVKGDYLPGKGDKSAYRSIRLIEEITKNHPIVLVSPELKALWPEKGMNLRSANLRSANLSSADLRSADLSSANLRSANLRFADLRSANLRSANLRSADLRFANLSSADLRSADLSSANLRFANLRFANWLTDVKPPDGWVYKNGVLRKKGE